MLEWRNRCEWSESVIYKQYCCASGALEGLCLLWYVTDTGAVITYDTNILVELAFQYIVSAVSEGSYTTHKN